jgi:hypothetical protein
MISELREAPNAPCYFRTGFSAPYADQSSSWPIHAASEICFKNAPLISLIPLLDRCAPPFQSTSLDGAMSEGLGIIAKSLYIIAVIGIAHGGWQVRSGNADMGKMSIVGDLLLVIADALFQAGRMPTISIGRADPSSTPTPEATILQGVLFVFGNKMTGP